MNALLQIALSNAAICGMMTVLLLPLARWLRRPALTHALCVLILLKLLTPPLFDLPVVRHSTAGHTRQQQVAVVEPAPSRFTVPVDSAEPRVQLTADQAAFESTPSPTSVSGLAPPAPVPQPSRGLRTRIWQTAADHWRSWLLACWIASAVFLGAVTLGRIIRLGLTVRRATVSGHDITPQVELLSKRLGIRRVPRVRFIIGSPPPMLLALFCRPELVIPIDLWDRLDDRQRQTLLLHELAHLRRGDHWVRYLELLATCLYWWHFATWLARRALHEAEEYCCDAWVVWAMPDASHTYMTTLLDAVEFMSQCARPRLAAAPVLASGMGQFHDLQRRLTMVSDRNVQRRLGGRGWTAVVLLSAVALPLGAKVASGDERGAAPAAAALKDIAPAAPDALAAAEDPREPAGEAPKDPDRARSAQPQDEVARLEAELAAARKNVERLQRQLDRMKSKSSRQSSRYPEARLGYILFRYQGAGPDGTVLAFDGGSDKLLWTLKAPLNADSVIQCYDNETLLIKSADGYTRLVTAEDGHVIQAWAPGVEAPKASASHSVNPFRNSALRSTAAQPSSPETPRASSSNSQDQEKRMERMEQSIRALTDAVDRLAREQKERRGSGQR